MGHRGRWRAPLTRAGGPWARALRARAFNLVAGAVSRDRGAPSRSIGDPPGNPQVRKEVRRADNAEHRPPTTAPKPPPRSGRVGQSAGARSPAGYRASAPTLAPGGPPVPPGPPVVFGPGPRFIPLPRAFPRPRAGGEGPDLPRGVF